MKLFITIALFCLMIVQAAFAQGQASRTDSTAQNNRIIDLTKLGKTYTISARMELPQVKMFDRRITPDFKEVRAEKSFINELASQAEQIQYEPISSGRVAPIDDIDALLKKKRF
jgi:hypothetical protein